MSDAGSTWARSRRKSGEQQSEMRLGEASTTITVEKYGVRGKVHDDCDLTG